MNMFIAGAMFALISRDMLREGKIPVAAMFVCLFNLWLAHV